ncbi:hypothetical protein TNCV_4850451 [Trichonephila clavipes]|nr:hypothetical protein TNCV_4850451 [Trichonephila clavipes]
MLIAANSSCQKRGSGVKLSIILAKSQSFLFPRLKLSLKVKTFDDIPNIQRNVTRLLNCTPKEDSMQSLQDMYSRSKRYIVMGGDYLEGDDKSRFQLCPEDNRGRVWRRLGQCAYPAFNIARHTGPQPGVTVCGAISFDIWTSSVFVRAHLQHSGTSTSF